MRRCVLCCFAVASVICCNVFANDKLYVSSRDIMICDNGIFVKIEDCMFKTKKICRDDIGNYIVDFEAKTCPDCDRDYPAYEKDCPYEGMHDNNDQDDE